MRSGDPAVIVENTFSLDNFTAYSVARENKPLIDALNSALDVACSSRRPTKDQQMPSLPVPALPTPTRPRVWVHRWGLGARAGALVILAIV